MECIFCKIVNGQIPSQKVYEDNTVLALLDINPDSIGHTLIIPKQHFCDLEDINQEILNHIMEVAKILNKKFKNKLKYDGLTLVQNNGLVQEQKHYHLHFKPYYLEKKNITKEEVYKLLK